MSRQARDFSWHLVALAMVVAGLVILAPLAWWRTQEPHESRARRVATLGAASSRAATPRDRNPVIATTELRPQMAPIGPLIADQISLDPSIHETPALPVATGPDLGDLLETSAMPDIRLSATLVRPSPLPQPQELQPQLPLPANPSPFPMPEPAVPGAHAWSHPIALIEQLQSLVTSVPSAANWAEQTIATLERIVATNSLSDPRVGYELANLRQSADAAKTLSQQAGDDQGRSKILRAGYSIVRRMVIWDIVHSLAKSDSTVAAPIVDRHAWMGSLAEVDQMLQATGAAAHWRKYLLIDRACIEFDSSSRTPAEQRELARDILHRLHSTQLSHQQEKFLCTPPFKSLDEQLQARAAELPDLPALLAAIERYEHDFKASTANALALEYDILRWSPDGAVRDLAEAVNAYYRNANVRVAISDDLANRMIPSQSPQVEAVDDTILGAWVSGQAQTNTKVKVVLTPDKHRWNVGLEAMGDVLSDTSSSKGPATFYQRGWSMFRARKRLTIDRRGIRMFSAEAEANSNNDLADFETDFDPIPLIGPLVRNIARNQYDNSQMAAKGEVEGKIVGRATTQLDAQVEKQLEKSKQEFQVKVIKPLRDLSLEPTPVEMETTADRLIARYRLASRDEIGAHTPRPQAPSDSMLSVQVHETAMNNILDQLHLHGRRAELVELFKEMTTRFSPTRKIEVPEDLPENVFVTFADEDPIRVDCQDGHVRLTIRLKELAQEGTKNRWTNFTVHAYYAPSADQLDANLYRDGIIELIGDNRPLSLGQRTALSAIFARVLSRNRKLHVINQQISQAPQLRDQQVTQFVIHDGWIGVALGPKAPGRQAAMTPRTRLQRE
ncbi:MAG TPA: hypothetical protein VGI40_26220 [Pirellulaceae bacterium]|jgi:hypothetical protein